MLIMKKFNCNIFIYQSELQVDKKSMAFSHKNDVKGFIVAGESSGDSIGSRLVNSLLSESNFSFQLRGIGG